MRGKDWLPPGFFSPSDIERYRTIYQDLVPACGSTVEVGCYLGRSICSVADIIVWKSIYVRCIDTFEPLVESPVADHEKKFRWNIALFTGLKSRLIVMPEQSLDAAKKLIDGHYDFIFLDGDHRYETVKAELEAFEPKIKKGGYIGGHDYIEYPGVTRAVNERYKNVETSMDSTIWLVHLT